MKVFKKVFKFAFANRRLIGLAFGSILTISGLPEYGEYVTKVGEL